MPSPIPGLPPVYHVGSLKPARATANKTEAERDISATQSQIYIGAGAAYPFAPIPVPIDERALITATRNADGSVTLAGVGEHSLFPAFEIIINGTVAFKSYPNDPGPTLQNLLGFDDFSFRVIVSTNGTVQVK